MSLSDPTKNCPRCQTLLPVEARFYGTCGMQFSVPGAPAAQGIAPGANYGAAPYGGAGAPGGWPQSQPPYPPQGQPSLPGYTPAAVALPPRKSNTKLLVTLIAAVVLIGGGIAGSAKRLLCGIRRSATAHQQAYSSFTKISFPAMAGRTCRRAVMPTR